MFTYIRKKSISTNIVKDEPVNSSSHSDEEEDIGKISGGKQEKHQQSLTKRDAHSFHFQNVH